MKFQHRSRRPARPLALGLVAVLGLAACDGAGGGNGDAAGEVDPEDPEAAAGDWEPDGQITMVVPFAAGGGSDLFGRAMAAGIEEVRPEVSIAVENRTGGAGAVGYGYFLEQTGNPQFLLPAEVARSLLPAAQEVPFDWDTWTSVGGIFEDINYLVVSSDSEWETIEEFMEDAEERSAQGQPMRVGVPAAGGVDEILARGLAEEAGIDFEIVAYDGTGETSPALQGGDIDASTINPSDGRQEVENDIFRALLGFAEERLDDPAFSEVPVSAESGYEALTFTKYRGLILPPDVPAEAVAWYMAALQDWTETDSFQEYMESAALTDSVHWGEEWDVFLEDWNAQVIDGFGGDALEDADGS